MVEHKISQHPGAKPRFFYGYTIVIALSIIQMVMLGPRMSFGVFFKPVLNDFGWSRALISGAISSSSVIQGLFGIIMGGFNDRLGPRKVLTFCGLLLGLGYLLMSRFDTAWQLYLFYAIIIGIGMGGILAPPMSTVARWFVKRRSVMTGIVIAGGGIGGIVMPPVTNWLISEYGWRTSFMIMGSAILVIIVLASQFLKRDPSHIGQEPYGKTIGAEQRIDLSIEGLSLKQTAHTAQFWMTVTILFCSGYLTSTVITHIVPHITDIGISAAFAANILAEMSGASLIGSIAFGLIADRIGNRQAYVICQFLMLSSILLVLVAGEPWIFYIFAIASGFGGGGATMLISPLVADLFGIRSHGLIFGVCLFSQTIAGALGAFIAGYIFDVTYSYRLAFLICAGMAVAGVILSMMLRPIKKREMTLESSPSPHPPLS